ncbi:MAG TPA: hypothetical protein VIQ30_26130 [Pseudonocardia sp.]
MNVLTQRVCIWLAPVGFAMLFGAFFAGSQFPFPSPNHDAAYIGGFYLEHVDGIRLMAVLVTTGSALTAPIAAVLGVHLLRIRGAIALALLEFGMGCVSALTIGIPSFFWQAAAFRPERDPVITQTLHDAGWLCFVATVFIVIVQVGAAGLAVLTDPGDKPVFPRWFGYLSLWVCAALLPGVLVLWFKTGPFAWNGVLTIYLAFLVFGAWFAAVIVLLLRMSARSEDVAA